MTNRQRCQAITMSMSRRIRLNWGNIWISKHTNQRSNQSIKKCISNYHWSEKFAWYVNDDNLMVQPTVYNAKQCCQPTVYNAKQCCQPTVYNAEQCCQPTVYIAKHCCHHEKHKSVTMIWATRVVTYWCPLKQTNSCLKITCLSSTTRPARQKWT